MAIQTCITCEGQKEVETVDGWQYVSVVMCDSCAAPAESAPAEQNETFDVLLTLEEAVQDSQATAALGLYSWDRDRGMKCLKVNKARLYEAVGRLTPDELRAYGEYRKANR